MKYSQVFPVLALAALALATQLSTSCDRKSRIRQYVDLDLAGGPSQPAPASETVAETARTLRVMTYNVFLRPDPLGWGDARKCRARQIGERLADRADDLDLVVLNESFAKRSVRHLVDSLGDDLPYRVLRKPEGRFLSTNGGLSILSRHPIRRVFSKQFDTCSSWGDCFAAKGFLHAVVEVSSNLRVNVLATHLDAGDVAGSPATRERQLSTIREYVDTHDVGDDWPTMLLGDLNINGIRGLVDHIAPNRPDRSEYQNLLAEFARTCTDCTDGSCLRNCSGRPVDAIRAESGPWAFTRRQTRPLHTMNCRGQSLAPCRDYNGAGNWRDRLRLDYVLKLRTRTPTRARAEVATADQLAFRDDACGTNYLSDHKAVRAEMRLHPAALADADAEPTASASTR